MKRYRITFADGHVETLNATTVTVADGTVTFDLRGYTHYYPDHTITFVLVHLIRWSEVTE